MVNGDQSFRCVKTQTGELSSMNCSCAYGDTLIYGHELTLYQVMDLLINHYVIGIEP